MIDSRPDDCHTFEQSISFSNTMTTSPDCIYNDLNHGECYAAHCTMSLRSGFLPTAVVITYCCLILRHISSPLLLIGGSSM